MGGNAKSGVGSKKAVSCEIAAFCFMNSWLENFPFVWRSYLISIKCDYFAGFCRGKAAYLIMFRVLLKITTPVFLQYTKEKFFTKILHALLLSNQVNCFQNHVERNLSKLLNRRLKNIRMETSPLTWQNTSE